MSKHTIWLVMSLAFLNGCQKEAPYQKPLTPVRVQAVEIFQPDQGQKYSGNIVPLTRVDEAFRLGGYVANILEVSGRLVQEGDVVKKGAVLVGLRQSDYTVKVEQAQSQLDQALAALTQTEEGVKGARAAREKAQLDWERANTLFAAKSLIKPDYDAAKAQLDGAQAQLDGAEAQAKLARARIAGAQAQLREADIAVQDSSLKASIDGVVLKRLVEVGSLVGPGTPAFVIGDVRGVKSVFGVPDTALGRLRIGMRLPVTLEGVPGANYSGLITSISPTADPRTRVFEVEVTLPNQGGRLKPGMISSITIPGQGSSAAVPVIPLAAVVQPSANQTGYMVYVVGQAAGKTAVKGRMVQLGDALGDRIVVRDGVREGEKVVVTGASIVHDGETVEVVP